MPLYRKTTKSGNVIEIEFVNSKSIGVTVPRQSNYGCTPEDKKAQNLFRAKRTLSQTINANFTKNDLFLSLTFRGKGKPTYEQVEKALKQFTRAARTIRKLRRLPELKYVAVIEDSKRPHIHVVMNRMSIDEINDIWQHGKVISSRLEPNGEYTGLAYYITKEPARPHKKRWSQSKNLIKPEPEYEEISQADVDREIDAPKGYRLVYATATYLEEYGQYKYAKFVRYGMVDLAMGAKEAEEYGRLIE